MLVKVNTQRLPRSGKLIPLGNGQFTIVDEADYNRLSRYKWYAKKSFHRWYACRKVIINGKVIFLRMHRIIAETPVGMVCHHINGNTFDNRRANLLNMTWFDHTKMHSYR